MSVTLCHWLEEIPDDDDGGKQAIAPNAQTPHLLRWRYNIVKKQQIREDRSLPEDEWRAIKIRKIRRVLKPVDDLEPGLS